ncbi:MAG: glycosyltransferase, partial [Kiritimatiellae bacterium]|nr:glycosyltransferase [Kiritimatiellia bacterium]
MNVLLCLEPAGVRGGIEVFVERRAAELRVGGHRVEIAAGPPADFAAWDRIEVHKCSGAAALERFPAEKTEFWIHDHEPLCPRRHAYTPFCRNCTRASGLWPCLLCAPLCRHPGAALGRVFSQRRRLRAMRRFARVVALSGFMKDRLVASGIPASKIEVRPPEIRLPEPLGPLPEGVDLLYVGQLTRGKGVQVLLRAMALSKAPRTLDIVGSGNYESRLRALARELGIADRVRFRGWQPAPQDWMRAAR